MSRMCRANSAALVFALATALLGAWTFGSGFLLHRIELGMRSQCGHSGNASAKRDCWSNRRFDRALVVVVDALRLDFVQKFQPRGGTGTGTVAPFHNRMPFLGGLAADGSGRARLFAFEADPPTVTMQRLKALTTGSLPTFVDVGRNFAGGAITEDNILGQAASAGMRTVFVGDDTWSSLFPSSFADARPFPSFNVQDLHTVDNGVIGTLVPGRGLEVGVGAGATPSLRGGGGTLAVAHGNSSHVSPARLKGKASLKRSENATFGLAGWLQADARSWDIAIAHMLGVDHVGHRVGPYHPAMERKLEQTDRVLAAVWDSLPGDTLLIVLGDHGMTAGGNHGGASPAETHAALVLAAKSALFDESSPGAARLGAASLAHVARSGAAEDRDWFRSQHRCRQVDLVPTLSFLLGLPVPAASMGVLVPGLHYARAGELGSPESMGGQVAAETKRLLLNAEQIHRYIEAYAQAAPSFMDPPMRAGLLGLLQARARTQASLSRADGVESANEALRSSLAAVTGLCRKRWTQFDEAAMGRGALLIGAAAALTLRVSAGSAHVQARWLAGAALAGLVCSWSWQATIGLEWAASRGSEGTASNEDSAHLHHWVRGAVGDGPNAVGGASFEGAARLGAWVVLATLDSPVATAALAAVACWVLSEHSAHSADTGALPYSAASGSELGHWVVSTVIAARCATLWSNSYLDHEATIIGSLGTAVALAMLAQRWRQDRPLLHFGALAAGAASLGHLALQGRVLHASSQVPSLELACGVLAGTGVLAGLCFVVATLLRAHETATVRAAAAAAGVLAGGSVFATLLHGLLEQAAAARSPDLGAPGHSWVGVLDQASCGRWALGLGWASFALWLGTALWQRFRTHNGGGAELSSEATLPDPATLLVFVGAVLSLCPAAGVLGGLAGFASVTLAAVHCMSIVALAGWDGWWGDAPPGVSEVSLGATALYLAAWTHFFGTGHSASFASLRFSSAFVGFNDVNFLRGGAAVAVDTLAGPIVASLGLVALAVAPHGLAHGARTARPASPTGLGSLPSQALGSSAAVRTVAAWQFVWLAALGSSACFVLFARRHLMVWAIFAPKLCFDAACSAVALLLGLVAVCCSKSRIRS